MGGEDQGAQKRQEKSGERITVAPKNPGEPSKKRALWGESIKRKEEERAGARIRRPVGEKET